MTASKEVSTVSIHSDTNDRNDPIEQVPQHDDEVTQINCRILYSTQSGRARACARRVARIIGSSSTSCSNDDNSMVQLMNGNGTTFDDEIQQYNNNVIEWAVSLQSPPASTKTMTLLLLFISTTGDGEHTDTIQQTWKQLLQKSLPNNLFSLNNSNNVQFCLFCLGDRAYGDQFCAAGRKLATRLIQLGCSLYSSNSVTKNNMTNNNQSVCPIGYGDDNTPNGGVFYDLDDWIYTQLLPSLNIITPPTTTNTVHKNNITVDESNNNNTENIGQRDLVPPPYHVTIKNPQLSSSPDQQSSMADFVQENNTLICSGEQQSYMDEFFQRQRPVSAYTYEESFQNSSLSTLRRQSQHQQRNNNNSNDNSGTRSSLLPLFGRVVENSRITDKDWEQDTRHIRLEVTTPLLSTLSSPVSATSLLDQNNNSTFSAAVTSDDEKDDGKNTNNGDNGYIPQEEELVWSVETLPYRAGDVAAIMPYNSIHDVNRFIQVLPKRLQEIADSIIEIEFYNHNNSNTNSTDPPLHGFKAKAAPTSYFYPGVCYQHWPKVCTLRTWLMYCADIHALPEREDLRTLGYYCSVHHHDMGYEQRNKLISLSETKYSRLYVDYIIREKRSWVDVLYDFDSLRHEQSTLSIEVLFALLSPMRPRDYSIASSPTITSAIMGTSDIFNQSSHGGSSSRANEQENQKNCCMIIELCVAVAQGITPLGRSYHGLCTNFLANLQPETKDTVRLWIRPGSFHGLPLNVVSNNSNGSTNGSSSSLRPSVVKSPTSASVEQQLYSFGVPIICIGSGTGIAPLRGLLHERQAVFILKNTKKIVENNNYKPTTDAATIISDEYIEEATVTTTKDDSVMDAYNSNQSVSDCDNILFFGCRKASSDFYYRREWMHMESTNQLILLTAFSRDQAHRKDYVQHILQNEEDDHNFIVSFLVERQGCIYVAGNPNMARAVKEAIVEALSNAFNGSEQKAKHYLNKLHRDGRFVVEAWS